VFKPLIDAGCTQIFAVPANWAFVGRKKRKRHGAACGRSQWVLELRNTRKCAKEQS